MPPAAICAEIGTWKGEFAARILDVARPRELHLVDPWRFAPAYPQRWYGGLLATSQADMDAICASVQGRFAGRSEVRIHRCPSVEASALFANGLFDWVYIDGDHAFDSVLADLKAWYPKVRPGGHLVCDDYGWKDETGRLSIKAALDEFLLPFTGATFAMGGQFVIEVPRAGRATAP